MSSRLKNALLVPLGKLESTRAFRYFARHFFGLELAIATLVFLGLLLASIRWGFDSTLGLVFQENRSEIYSTLSTIFASLFGFTLAATTFVAGAASRNLLYLVTSGPHRDVLRLVFMSAIRWLGVATIVSLLGLVLDRGENPVFPLLLMFALVLVTFRLANCVYFLGLVVEIVSKPTDDDDDSETPRMVDRVLNR